MKRIIVVVLSVISAGELTIASEFVSRLPKSKYKLLFLVPDNYSEYLQSKGFDYVALDVHKGKDINREIIYRSIKEFQPDYFLLSDAYTLEYASKWCGLKFRDLKSFGIPVIGVDEYEFPSTGYKIDYYSDSFKRLPPFIDKCDYLIRDCPINKPAASGNHIWSFSLYNSKYSITDERKAHIKRKLNIEDGEKIIFLTVSSWEVLNTRKVVSLNHLVKWIPVMLKEYIKALGKKVAVIHVGCNEWKDTENTNLNYHYFPSLIPAEFDDYLFTSDLYITLNAASVTLTKAVYGGVPSLVFQNRKYIKFFEMTERLKQMPEWYRKMAEEVRAAYPFRASTFGWFKFLEPVLQDNEYANTFIEAPLFKMSEAVRLLGKYLYDTEAIKELKEVQSAYIDKILQLPEPDKIMSEINSLRG